MLDELALARVDLTAEHVAMGSTSSAISARSARGHCVLSAAGGPLSKQGMPAPVCAASERVQPLTQNSPKPSSKGEPAQGSIELGPLPSEVGLTGRLRLRRLLRVELFTIEEERLRCLHAVRGPMQA